ncbi:MAG TPA: PQQ-binding-like beta-propeller repeat protein [Gaiellaceae bacterium]|jgi:PQQ-dependent dehydrogenase (methanol/ethanol family)
MKAKRIFLAAGMITGCASLALIGGASAKRTAITPIPAFNASQLAATPMNDWVGVHGNDMNQQFSGLTQITSGNVGNLKIAWHTKVFIPTKGKPTFKGSLAEAQPVEYNGTLYMPDAKGNVYAMNATTGERLWSYKYKTPKGFSSLLQTSRGVAIGGGNVYAAETDAYVTALDQATGRVKWSTKAANWKLGYTFTAAPLYVNGLVIVGESGGDSGAPDQLVAMNANTGKVNWRWDAIPTGKQLGASSWSAPKLYTGGGAMWSSPAVDTNLGLVYIATGNPIPYNGADRGDGKNLFTESVVAVHINDGKLAWAFQEVHHDNWDYDPAANGVELFNLNINGKTREAIAQADKDGWVYILDRRTGKSILGMTEAKVPQSAAQHTYPTQPRPVGQPFAAQRAPKSWATYKEPNGKKVTVGALFTPYGETHPTAFAPSALGGSDYPPSAYSPKTGYLYICSKNSTAAFQALPEAKAGTLKPLGNFFQVDGLFAPKGSPATKAQGTVVAMNMRSNRIAWEVKFAGDNDPCYSGMLSTQGGLVFVGRNNGEFQAYSDTTGKLLWTSPKLAAGINAAPITYSVNGKQYVAVYAGGNALLGESGYVTPKSGSDLYAFQLPS